MHLIKCRTIRCQMSPQTTLQSRCWLSLTIHLKISHIWTAL